MELRNSIKNKFQKACSCLNHQQFSDNSVNSNLLKISSIKRRSSFKELVARHLLNEKHTYVCHECLSFSQDNFVQNVMENTADVDSTSESESEGEAAVHDIDVLDNVLDIEVLDTFLCELLKAKVTNKRFSDLPENTQYKLCQISKELGSLIHLDLYHDGIAVNRQYKDLTTLKQLNPGTWLEARNVALVSFLCGCANTSLDTLATHPKKLNAIVHSVEQVLYSRNILTITPFSFMRSMVSYSLTHNKISTVLAGGWEPSGGYTKIHDVLAAPCQPPACPSKDIHVLFDNNQKVGRSTTRIKEGSAIPMSICTSVSFIQSHGARDLQNNMGLMKSQWQPLFPEEEMRKVNDLEEEYLGTFRNYRADTMKSSLVRVCAELEMGGGGENGLDYVDVAVFHREAKHKDIIVCRVCMTVYPKGGTCICTKCHNDPLRHPKGFDPYQRTPSLSPAQPSTVTILDPCMVNPASKIAVQKVLDHIKEVCDIPNSRKWVSVWSDGVPYLYACQIQDNVHKCLSCGELTSISVSKEQCCANCDLSPAYTEFLLRPGPGHIELNMARCLLSSMWVPLISHIAVQLGFRTDRALEVVRKGIDHHRSRQILSCLQEALSLELLVPFVKLCKLDGIVPSVQGYTTWLQHDVKDPVYMYCFFMCYYLLLGFHVYTEGTRKCNSNTMMAGRVAFIPLFFARQHPKYRELHLRDMVQRVTAPPDVQDYMCKSEAFSTTSTDNSAQGADFIHEQVFTLTL